MAYSHRTHPLHGDGFGRGQVTVLFTMGPVSQHGPFDDWVKHYAELVRLTAHYPFAMVRMLRMLGMLAMRGFRRGWFRGWAFSLNAH
jgi:hypothetical protein